MLVLFLFPDKALPILWFFPYFMEKRICACMPSLTMLDYKVRISSSHTLSKDILHLLFCGETSACPLCPCWTPRYMHLLPLHCEKMFFICCFVERHMHALSVHVGLQGTYLFFPYFVKRRSSSVALWRDIPCSLTMLDSKVHNSSTIALGRDVFVCVCLPPVNKNSLVIVMLACVFGAACLKHSVTLILLHLSKLL